MRVDPPTTTTVACDMDGVIKSPHPARYCPASVVMLLQLLYYSHYYYTYCVTLHNLQDIIMPRKEPSSVASVLCAVGG